MNGASELPIVPQNALTDPSEVPALAWSGLHRAVNQKHPVHLAGRLVWDAGVIRACGQPQTLVAPHDFPNQM